MFDILQIREKVWRIWDEGKNTFYLVEGEEKAAVIDTGITEGASITPMLRTLTDKPLILVLIAFWMLMSSLSVMIQVTYFKKTGGKRIFKMSPIHHHFELSGMHEVRIVAMYMTTTAILCLVTLLGVL